MKERKTDHRFKPIASTLAYILSPDGKKVLLVHRTLKEGDENHGKYNGIGGKIERGESVVEGMRREIREEAGIEVVSMRLRGTMVWTDFGPHKEDWLAFVYVVDAFEGRVAESSDEGRLDWFEIDRIMELPMWKGDRLFLPLVFDGDPRPFHGLMRYEGEEPAEWRFERVPADVLQN